MDQPNLISFVIIGLFCTSVCARPGQLKQQKYEFQESHSTSSQHQTASSSSQNARLQVAPMQHEAPLWSQQHPNEVNAFAEMFRQNYNQMVARHNEMMQMHQQTWGNMFVPVTYELYHVPVGYTWNNYFGNQQQYVQGETERMSRQLIEDIEQGRRSQQELMNPSFFIDQAASELNRVHQSHQIIESAGVQDGNNFENLYQQQQQPVFMESPHQTELEQTRHAVVYNEKTKQYEYVELLDSHAVPPHEELAGPMNVQRPSYIQSLPPVQFDNEKLNKYDQEIEQIEVHTPFSVETPRSVQRLNQQVLRTTPKPLIDQLTQSNNDEFYGSTYDQQPKFDLQFIESQSTSATSSRGNIMSLVRNRTKVKVSTTETPTTTTTTTTTPLPTTTSGIMSMLPNKKPAMNYTDLYQQVQAELNRQLTQMTNNKTEETHFMGMTSNADHVKLTYETVNHGKDEKESRGDQGITADDYNYDDEPESEPGIGHYTVKPEPTLMVLQPTASPSTPPPVHSNPFYSAELAPFPTTTSTVKPPNPYYSAPLAPFPEDTLRESSGTQQQQLHYAEHSEITDMNQEIQTIEHHYGGHFEEAHTIEDLNNHDDFNQGQFQISHGYTDMHQFEDEQQRYTDVGSMLDIGQSVQHPMPQKCETPPEQAYRNPELQHSSVKHVHQEQDIQAHVQEVIATEPPAPIGIQNQKKNWFQRQMEKIKNALR